MTTNYVKNQTQHTENQYMKTPVVTVMRTQGARRRHERAKRDKSAWMAIKAYYESQGVCVPPDLHWHQMVGDVRQA